MNNNINIVNTGHIKPSTTGTASAVETSPQGIDSTKAYNSTGKISLFHDTIQKQHRESTSNNSNENNKSSGNELPYVDNLSEVAEIDGRSTSRSTTTENSVFASTTQNTSTLVTTEFDKESSIANEETHNPILVPAPVSQTTSSPLAGQIAGPLADSTTAVLNNTMVSNSKDPASGLNKTSLATASLTSSISDNAKSETNDTITSPHNSIKNTTVETSTTAKTESSPRPTSGTDVKQPHIVTELQKQESVRSAQDNIIETVKVTSLNNNVDNKINIMPSQISPLIKAELHTDTHNSTATEKPAATTTTNISQLSGEYLTTTNSSMEKPSLQTMDASSINMQFTDSIADKNQLLTSLQSSLLLAANKAELTGDGSPVSTNTATNTATTTLSSANATPISQLLSTPQTEINEPFGRASWSQAMGKQVLMMINQNIGSAEIRLNPANLGPIEIHIDMSEDQVNVAMSSRHAIVREAMEQALPRLREMLNDNGFNLSDTDVSQHSFAEQREQNTNNQNIIQQSNEKMQPIAINESTLQQTAATDSTVDYYI